MHGEIFKPIVLAMPYNYLQAVFAIVMHFKVRRRTKRLLRHAFRFAGLQFDKNADPYTAIIRCTCGGAADNKMVSKWARALRYAARRKPAGMRLKPFMKVAGGVNECAASYANVKRIFSLGFPRGVIALLRSAKRPQMRGC